MSSTEENRQRENHKSISRERLTHRIGLSMPGVPSNGAVRSRQVEELTALRIELVSAPYTALYLQ